MSNIINPFQIKTPEKLNPNEAINLFVDVFTDYQKIKTEGHTFILGPRGIGKSMIFRYLQPDCQCLSINGDISKIDFLGFYVPLRNASFTTITELRRLANNASQIINEHIMSVYFLQMVYKALSNPSIYGNECAFWDQEAMTYYDNVCSELCYIENTVPCESMKIYEIFTKLAKQMESFYRQAIGYTKKLAFTKEIYPYDGPLYDYLGTVIPAIELLHDINCFKEKKVFFLIDDAHCLTNLQTHILNYWVSTRTSGEVSLKISTQYDYKNYYTITGETIDAPHDYSEVDMFRVYTSKVKKTYAQRITEIVEKRLKSVGIDRSPTDFFPPDTIQENKIKAIEEEYIKRFDEGKGRGNKRTDDSLRYARPDYIKSLTGTSKSSYTYSYSGFEQLIHLSSGIARLFLESAYKMYAEELSKSTYKDKKLEFITPSTQNQVIREDANQFLFKELPKYAQGTTQSSIDDKIVYPEEDILKLSKLINGLGGLFREILLSDRSERKVFSIAISDSPSAEVKRILQLGVKLGYFHQSTIGKKDSKSGGRTNLYILNRRLAPIWTLDPTSFSGYLFVKNKLLEDTIINPDVVLRRLGRTIEETDNEENEYVQLSFFSQDEKGHYTVEAGDEDD